MDYKDGIPEEREGSNRAGSVGTKRARGFDYLVRHSNARVHRLPFTCRHFPEMAAALSGACLPASCIASSCPHAATYLMAY